jgi:hypothetical protein
MKCTITREERLPREIKIAWVKKFELLECLSKVLHICYMEYPSINTACIEAPESLCTDKKENKIFLKYKEIQRGRVQSHICMTNGLLINVQ